MSLNKVKTILLHNLFHAHFMQICQKVTLSNLNIFLLWCSGDMGPLNSRHHVIKCFRVLCV